MLKYFNDDDSFIDNQRKYCSGSQQSVLVVNNTNTNTNNNYISNSLEHSLCGLRFFRKCRHSFFYLCFFFAVLSFLRFLVKFPFGVILFAQHESTKSCRFLLLFSLILSKIFSKYSPKLKENKLRITS